LAEAVTKLVLSQQTKFFWADKAATNAKAMAALAQSQIAALSKTENLWKALETEAQKDFAWGV
jgi:hypothetical protein